MEYQEVLLSLLTVAGLVPAVGGMIALFEEAFRPLNKGEKRTVAIVMTFVLSTIAYLLATLAGWLPNPVAAGDYELVVNDLVMLVTLNFTASQALLSILRSDTLQITIGNKARYTKQPEPLRLGVPDIDPERYE